LFIGVFAGVKIIVNRLLGDSVILYVRASKLQVWISILYVIGAVFLLVMDLIGKLGAPIGEMLEDTLSLAYWAVALSLPIDIALLSYIKYRDAIKRNTSSYWLIILPVLWMLILWFAILFFRGSAIWVLRILSLPYEAVEPFLIAIWLTIPLIQLILHIKLYKQYTVSRPRRDNTIDQD